VQDIDLKAAYDKGYRSKTDRLRLFPWNNNIEHIQNLTSEESESYLNTLFDTYKGQYRLERRPLNE
jgi:hypothetical protein